MSSVLRQQTATLQNGKPSVGFLNHSSTIYLQQSVSLDIADIQIVITNATFPLLPQILQRLLSFQGRKHGLNYPIFHNDK